MALEEALDELRALLAAACPGVPLQDDLAPPAGGPALALVALSAALASRRPGGGPLLEVLLRALVAPVGPGALLLLEQCLLAVESAPGCDLEPEAPSEQLWASLGGRPGPALVVRRRVALGTLPAAAPAVTAPPRVSAAPGRLLQGVVLGPDDVPLPDVEVAADGGPAVRCAPDGTFRLLALAGTDPHRLLVRVKGRLLSVQVPDGPEPLTVHCDTLEP